MASSASGLGGLRRLYLLRPAGKKDEFVVVSTWDSEEDAERYAQSGANRDYGKELAPLQKGKELVEKFEVALRTVGDSAREE